MNKLPVDFNCVKYGLSVRLVTEEDAEFIVFLRVSEKASNVIHHTDNDIDKQKKWIKEYKKRESEGMEYYFMFSKNGEKQGVARIYNIHEHDFTSGSWVFSPTADKGCAILGDIISREIAFELNQGSINYFDVRNNNINVQRYTLMYKPTYLRTDDESNMYYLLEEENFNKYKQLFLRMLIKQL